MTAATAERPSLTFDPALQAWIVDDPALCEAVIAHPALMPPPYAELYAKLGAHFGVDFSPLVFAFEHIPLCLHADPHARARRGMAAHIAARKPAIDRTIPALVERHLACFGTPGEIEVMAAVVHPLVRDVLALIADLDDIGFDTAPTGSQIFSRGVGMAKRKRMAAEIGALTDTIRAQLPADASPEEVGRRLSLLILGRDALSGSLGTSLHRVLAGAGPIPLASIPFPPHYLETGVPYTERFATAPVEIGGRVFEAGTKFRVFLKSFGLSGNPRDYAKFFGVGAHTCLGRPVSLDIWREIGRVFAGLSSRVQVLAYKLREDDDVFAMPTELTVRIEP